MTESADEPRLARWLAFAGLGLSLAMLIHLIARPLATDDLWWHLTHGQAFVAEGPWLEGDPTLHTPLAGPIATGAWLFEVALHTVDRSLGHAGLRLFHVLIAVAVLALAYSIFRREGRSHTLASLGTVLVVVIAWHRFFQLRPHLASIGMTLLLYRILIEDRRPPSWSRIAAAAGLLALWANLHPVYLVGPGIVVVAAVAAGLEGWVARGSRDESSFARARGLALAGVALVVAASLNPAGPGRHATFFRAAGEPALWRIDEWAHFQPWALGPGFARFSLLTWAATDVVLLLLASALVWSLMRVARRPSRDLISGLDLVLAALALCGAAAIFVAVRFQWLIFFPILYLVHFARVNRLGSSAHGPAFSLGAGVAAASLALAFPALGGYRPGAWGVPKEMAAYFGNSSAAGKYCAPGIEFIDAVGLEGRLFNEYWMGGYLGYRFSPRLEVFVNGSINVAPEVLRDHRAVMEGDGKKRGETAGEILERRGVDVVFAMHTPRLEGVPRWRITPIRRLEGSAGWVQVYRGLECGVLVRENERNAGNLARVAAFYRDAGLEFDRESGVDLLFWLQERPDHAIASGVAPENLAEIVTASRSADPAIRYAGLEGLAWIYLMLGEYEAQIASDEAAHALRSNRPGPLRRLVQAELRLDHPRRALAWARRLLDLDPDDPGSRHVATIAERASKRSARGESSSLLLDRMPLLPPDSAIVH